MRRQLAAAGLALAFILGACATTGTGTGPTPSVSVRTADEKALIAAEGAFKASLILTNGLLDAGQLKGDRAVRARAILVKAKSALDAARAAYRAGDAIQTALHINEAGNVAQAIAGLLR